MKAHNLKSFSGFGTLVLAIFMLVGFTTTAFAQPREMTPYEEYLAATVFAAPTPVEFATISLEALSADEWKNVTKEQIESLKSGYAIERQEAMRNIIYAAVIAGRGEGLDKASWSLYNIYRFDRNENHRLMALGALHAVGNDNVMRLLSNQVQFEKSPHVRRIASVVVNEHFGG